MRAHRKSGTPQARSTQISRLEARRHCVPALNHHVAVGGCDARALLGDPIAVLRDSGTDGERGQSAKGEQLPAGTRLTIVGRRLWDENQ